MAYPSFSMVTQAVHQGPHLNPRQSQYLVMVFSLVFHCASLVHCHIDSLTYKQLALLTIGLDLVLCSCKILSQQLSQFRWPSFLFAISQLNIFLLIFASCQYSRCNFIGCCNRWRWISLARLPEDQVAWISSRVISIASLIGQSLVNILSQIPAL